MKDFQVSVKGTEECYHYSSIHCTCAKTSQGRTDILHNTTTTLTVTTMYRIAQNFGGSVSKIYLAQKNFGVLGTLQSFG